MHYLDLVDETKELNPNRKAVLTRLQKLAAGKIKLGIDLQGVHCPFLVAADYSKVETMRMRSLTNSASGKTNAAAAAISDDRKRGMLNEAVEVLRKRVDALGVSEPVIQPEGEDRILIQLPGLSEDVKEEARQRIQRVAFLQFRLVHPDSDNLINQGLTEPGYEILRMKESGEQGKATALLIKKKPELTGNAIKNAIVGHDAVGAAEIEFTLTGDGADIFSKVTSENIGHRLAIVLDGQLISAPNIQSEIGANGVITGHFTQEEAQIAFQCAQ